jgi:hypothetical protein
VAKAVRQLAENPRHSSLNTHEYDSLDHPFDPKAKVFGAYAQNNTPGAYRIFWCYGPEKGEMTIIAITPHPRGRRSFPQGTSDSKILAAL